MADAEGLATTIRRYCMDDEHRLARAIQCQEFVVTTHSARSYAKQLVELIREMGESSRRV